VKRCTCLWAAGRARSGKALHACAAADAQIPLAVDEEAVVLLQHLADDIGEQALDDAASIEPDTRRAG
jgi:hypothetical protein